MQTITTHIRNKTLVELNSPLSPSPLHDWLTDDIEVLWIPIFDYPNASDFVQHAERMRQQYGDYRILRNFDDVAQLPIGIRGWIIPATANDSDLICLKHDNGHLEYFSMAHPHTGQRMSYQSSGAYDLKHNQNY